MRQFLTQTRLKQRLGLMELILAAQDEARLAMALRAAEAALSDYSGRRFAPLRMTLRAYLRRADEVLVLPEDALSVEAVEVNGRGIDPEDVALEGGCLLRRIDGGRFGAGVARITGLWAYHRAPELAWRVSGDALTVGVSGLSSTLSVSNTQGTDAEGYQPRLHGGQLMRLGDELLRVLSTTPTTLSVRRGVNGTTAAAHLAGVPVETFWPDPLAEALGYRWAAWLYREADGDPAREVPAALRDELRQLTRVEV